MLNCGQTAGLVFALAVLLGGCGQPANKLIGQAGQPVAAVQQVVPGAQNAETFKIVNLPGFDQVAREIAAVESGDHIQSVYVEGIHPEISLDVRWRNGDDEQTLFSTLLPIPVATPPDTKNTRGYVVLQVPPLTSENRDRELRLTWHGMSPGLSEQRKRMEWALPLGSILSDDILAADPKLALTGAASTSADGNTRSVTPSVSFVSDDHKRSLHVTATVASAPAWKPLAEQAAEFASNNKFYRGFAYQFVEDSEQGRRDLSFADSTPDGQVRLESTDSGHEGMASTLTVRVSGDTTVGLSIRAVKLTGESVTFEVIATLTDRIVQAGLVEVPVDKTEIFWIWPRVPFFRETQKPAVGIALHVFRQEPPAR